MKWIIIFEINRNLLLMINACNPSYFTEHSESDFNGNFQFNFLFGHELIGFYIL